MNKRKALLVLALLLVAGGCQKGVMVDPETGEEIKTYAVDPNLAGTVEAIAGAAVTGGTVASAWFPWLAPIVTAAGGALASWRRLKPKLTVATSERDLAYKGGAVLAEALEEIKTNMPEIWAKIGPQIEKAAGPVSEAENAIRGFRGLPPR